MSALVIGNPRLPTSVTEQWGWSDIPYAEQEAEMVAEMLHAKALIGSQVKKKYLDFWKINKLILRKKLIKN